MTLHSKQLAGVISLEELITPADNFEPYLIGQYSQQHLRVTQASGQASSPGVTGDKGDNTRESSRVNSLAK